MLPETFWGGGSNICSSNTAPSFLSGAGNTMIIAIVGTFLGCLIGFIVGIIQTIPLTREIQQQKKDAGWNSEIYHGLLRGIFPWNAYDGTGNVYLLRQLLPV